MSRHYYAGIGSRGTPRPILKLMQELAARLADQRWVLRTGHAAGADWAFERGAGYRAEVYLPWPTFERGEPINARLTMTTPTREALDFTAGYHPTWDELSPGARQLHGRNAHEILGPYVDRPVDCVICWTPEGEGSGGTGQALRIARAHDLPVYDLADPAALSRIEAFLAR